MKKIRRVPFSYTLIIQPLGYYVVKTFHGTPYGQIYIPFTDIVWC